MSGRRVAARVGCVALLFGLALSPLGGSATAVAEQPFLWRNSSVVAATTGLPRARSGRLPTATETRLDLVAEVANHFTRRSSAREAAYLDGETASLVWRMEHGLGAGWALDVELAALRHSGGFLDGFIEGWHDTFGLPQGGREQIPGDQLQFLWQRDGVQRLDLQSSASGVGDLRLGVARQLVRQDARDLALRLDVSVPTGRAGKLTGSGGSDVALSLAWSERQGLSALGLVGHFGMGVMRAGDDDVLADARKRLAGFGHATLVWPVTERLHLKAQLDGHTRLSNSAVREMGGWSLQGALGGAWAFSPRTALEFAVHEDLRPDSAPDVAFQLALRLQR